MTQQFMAEAEASVVAAGWPADLGEMAALIRAHDWAATPLGAITTWPLSLRQAVNICLGCGFPSFVCWGPELIQLYNDAARSIVPSTHAGALGVPARQAWTDIWVQIGPLVERVLRGGKPALGEDVPLLLQRGGAREVAYFTFSLGALRDEVGAVTGVCATVIETTARVQAVAARHESEARLAMIFERAPVGLSEIAPDGRFLQANAELGRIVGRSPEALCQITIADVTYPDDVAPSLAAASQVLKTGGSATLEKRYQRPDGALVMAQSSLTRLDSTDGGEPRLLAATVNLTARRQAEEALRESEQRLRALLQASSEVLFRMSPDWGEMRELAGGGLSADTPQPQRDWLQACIPLEDQPLVRQAIEQAIASRRVLELEHRVIRADGGLGWRLSRAVPILAPDGSVMEWFGAASDVTARRQAEELLRESEARIRAIANLVPDLLWSDDAQGHTDWVNRRWLEYTGLSEEENLGDGWRSTIHPEDLPRVLSRRNKALQKEDAWESEHRIRRFDGDFRWHLVRAEPLRDRDGRVVQWFGSATDVHEQRLSRKLLEQRVTERTQALRQLLLRVETVQDDERRRIARELHDSLGQYLASLLLAVSGLKGELPDPSARQRLEALEAQLQRVDRELDRLVFILRPTALEDCGLGEGVEAYVQTWSDLTGVAVDLELQGLDSLRLPAQVQAAAFRVVQEALTNVAKYAQASQVSVGLTRRQRHLVGTIEDDGIGFDATDATIPAPSRVNWGLLGMQERIEALGGSFAIESHPGAGTTVLWRVPLVSPGSSTELAAGPAQTAGVSAQPQVPKPAAAGTSQEWNHASHPLAQVLLSRLAEAEEAVRARDDFLAIVGHQLRSPMNALSLQLQAVERMLGHGNSARAARELGRARRILRRIVQRATVLLDISRLNAGQFKLDVEPVDVTALVERVLDGCAEDAAFRSSQLHAAVEPGLTAHWDLHGVEEVLCNLITNAIKYGEGTAVKVTVAKEGADQVRLTVSDGGPGINPAQRLRLSEKFEDVAGVPSTSSGLGIGLWLVGQVARAHGGMADVEVGPQGGTTVSVKLPVFAISTRPPPAASP